MAELRGFEKWFEERYPDATERQRHAWGLAAIRAHTRWGEGREVSQADFESALEEAAGLTIGGDPAPKPKEPDPTHH